MIARLLLFYVILSPYLSSGSTDLHEI